MGCTSSKGSPVIESKQNEQVVEMIETSKEVQEDENKEGDIEITIEDEEESKNERNNEENTQNSNDLENQSSSQENNEKPSENESKSAQEEENTSEKKEKTSEKSNISNTDIKHAYQKSVQVQMERLDLTSAPVIKPHKLLCMKTVFHDVPAVRRNFMR